MSRACHAERHHINEPPDRAVEAQLQLWQVGQVPGLDRDANQLRALAPLIAIGPTTRLVAPVTLVANAERVVGVTDAELLRPFHGQPLAVASLATYSEVAITSWGMGRYTGVGIVELGATPPDIVPLPIADVAASVNTHNAPAAIVTIVATATGYERRMIAVHVDPDDTRMSERTTYVASPLDPADVGLVIDGAPVFAWFPPDHVLGRPSEVVLVGLAYRYRGVTAKPRETPVIAELVGLDDLGRALIEAPEPDERPELAPAAGEIDPKS
jgi:hypothetical protein